MQVPKLVHFACLLGFLHPPVQVRGMHKTIGVYSYQMVVELMHQLIVEELVRLVVFLMPKGVISLLAGGIKRSFDLHRLVEWCTR